MEKSKINKIRNRKTKAFLERNGCVKLMKSLKKHETLEIGAGSREFSYFSGVGGIRLDLRDIKGNDIKADAKKLPFKGKKFKIVVAQLFLDLFDENELRVIGSEIYRVLNKKGKLLVVSDEIASLNGVIERLSKSLKKDEYTIPIIKKKKGKKLRDAIFIEDIGFIIVRDIEKIKQKINAFLEVIRDDKILINEDEKKLENFINGVEIITSSIKKDDRDYLKALFRIHLQNPFNNLISEIIEKNILNIKEITRLYAGEEAKRRIKEVMMNVGFYLNSFNSEFLEFDHTGKPYGVPAYCMLFEKR